MKKKVSENIYDVVQSRAVDLEIIYIDRKYSSVWLEECTKKV